MTTFVRVSKLSHFSSTVRQLGKDPEPIFSNAGLDPDVLANPDNFIPYSAYRRLLTEAVKVTDCERFGLLISRQIGLQSLGVVGFRMQLSPDLGTALGILSRFFHLQDQHGLITLEASDENFRLSHHIPDMEIPGSIQAIDISAAVGHGLINSLLGKEINALRYEFPYPQPTDVSSYDFLEAQELVFNTDFFSIVVDRKYLDSKIIHRDPDIASLLGEYTETIGNLASDPVANKVELIVKDMLSTGECTLEAVAELFRITPRTLQNRLKREHTSFHDIIEDVRKTLALHYLRSSRMDLTNIALLIGYSDSSAFSRSFRRWYNETPSHWRKSGESYATT